MQAIEDYKGNMYLSVSEMCRRYNVTVSAYYGRMSRGYTQEEALAGRKHKIIFSDHKGIIYNSAKEMCKAYHIDYSVYNARLNIGWTQEEALTVPKYVVKHSNIYDHLGNKFKSMNAMCSSYPVKTAGNYKSRLKRGMSVKDALMTPCRSYRKCVDFKGIEFKSVNEMCSHYGINNATYRARIKKGLTMRQSLLMPTGRSSI